MHGRYNPNDDNWTTIQYCLFCLFLAFDYNENNLGNILKHANSKHKYKYQY